MTLHYDVFVLYYVSMCLFELIYSNGISSINNEREYIINGNTRIPKERVRSRENGISR